MNGLENERELFYKRENKLEEGKQKQCLVSYIGGGDRYRRNVKESVVLTECHVLTADPTPKNRLLKL